MDTLVIYVDAKFKILRLRINITSWVIEFELAYLLFGNHLFLAKLNTAFVRL